MDLKESTQPAEGGWGSLISFACPFLFLGFFFKQNSPCVFHNKMLKLQEAKEMGGRHGAGDSEGCARKVMGSVAWIMAKEWTIQNG